jgi:hypothetical protein
VKAESSIPVPNLVVTETVTAPAVSEGSLTVSWVELLRVIEVPVLLPNFTAVTVVKFVPVMVTVVPPASLPLAGVALVTVGGLMKVKLVLVTDPPGVVTFTWTAPAPWALGLAFKVVALVKWTEAAAVAPNVTVDVAVKPVPVITTVVPPAIGPADGASEVIVGATSKVKLVLVPKPPGVVTFTWTGPDAWALVLAFKVVALVKWTEAADVAPNVTVDVAVKFVPVITTVVPPAIGPADGASEVTVGAAT